MQRALALYGLDKPIWIGESNVAPDDEPVRADHARAPRHAGSASVVRHTGVRPGARRWRRAHEHLQDRRRATGGPRRAVRPGAQRRHRPTGVHRVSNRRPVHELARPAPSIPGMARAIRQPTRRSPSCSRTTTNHTQWQWPAAVNRVTLERGTERVIVAWNASPKLVTGAPPGDDEERTGDRQVRQGHGRGGRPERARTTSSSTRPPTTRTRATRTHTWWAAIRASWSRKSRPSRRPSTRVSRSCLATTHPPRTSPRCCCSRTACSRCRAVGIRRCDYVARSTADRPRSSAAVRAVC